MNRILTTALLALLLTTPGYPEVQVTIDAAKGRKWISPFIYGKQVASRANEHRGGKLNEDIQFIKDSGLRLTRESWGNNCTKYNWKKRLTSAPNWFNNVYEDDWDSAAKWVQENFTGLYGMFAFQCLGWVAKTKEHNFDDWNEDRHGKRRNKNLAGNGDPEKYLQKIDAKYTVDILDHFFGPGGLGLDKKRFPIWHLDNEPNGWRGTHNDVEDGSMTAEECVQKYLAVAREVKTRHPDIQLMGPGFMEEWHWWTWKHEWVDGLPWCEYFIKRFGEESRKFGSNLIDIINYHTYVSQARHKVSDAGLLQEHRIFYDPEYDFPRANGCKQYPGGNWNENQTVEMIFARTEKWIDEYFGKDSGVGIGVTECGYGDRDDPMVLALWYASLLGTFSDHGVKVLTVWSWRDQYWEVLHLFARYAGQIRVESSSSDEEMVSAYSSMDKTSRKMTVILVNRNKKRTEGLKLSFKNWAPRNGQHQSLLLEKLPKGMTFKSHTRNALKKGRVLADNGQVTVELPPYSITAILLSQ